MNQFMEAMENIAKGQEELRAAIQRPTVVEVPTQTSGGVTNPIEFVPPPTVGFVQPPIISFVPPPSTGIVPPPDTGFVPPFGTGFKPRSGNSFVPPVGFVPFTGFGSQPNVVNSHTQQQPTPEELQVPHGIRENSCSTPGGQPRTCVFYARCYGTPDDTKIHRIYGPICTCFISILLPFLVLCMYFSWFQEIN